MLLSKTTTLLLLAMTTLIAGCTLDHDDTDDNGVRTGITNDTPICFQVAANSQTRGEAMKDRLSSETSFRVYATRQLREGTETGKGDQETFMRGVEVTYQYIYSETSQTAKWVWKPVGDYPWPQDIYLLRFYAIHPYKDDLKIGTTGDIATEKTLSYTTEHPLPGNYDLMYATAKTHRETTGEENFKDASDASAVTLQFHHALAQLQFYGRLSNDFANMKYRVEIKGIRLCNVINTATFTFSGDDAHMGETEAVAYSMGSDKGNYDLTMAAADPIAVTTTEAVSLSSPDNPLMVLPQTLTAWDRQKEQSGTEAPVTSGTYLAVTLRIIYQEEGKAAVYPLEAGGDFVTTYVPLTGTWEDTWEVSKTYKYTLTLGAGFSAAGNPVIQPINIEAAIAPWQTTEVTGSVQHIPAN